MAQWFSVVPGRLGRKGVKSPCEYCFYAICKSTVTAYIGLSSAIEAWRPTPTCMGETAKLCFKNLQTLSNVKLVFRSY